METSSTNLIVLKELVGNPPVQLDPIQQFLAPYLMFIHDFWISLWIMSAIIALVKVIFDYMKGSKR